MLCNSVQRCTLELCLTDRFQDGSGLDVVEALEQQHPDARAVILTGYGNIPTAVAAARLGAIDYIAKPATADEIVDALLAQKSAHASAPTDPILPDDAWMEHIEHFYHVAGENVSETVRLLQMHRRTLQRVLRHHGVVAVVHCGCEKVRFCEI